MPDSTGLALRHVCECMFTTAHQSRPCPQPGCVSSESFIEKQARFRHKSHSDDAAPRCFRTLLMIEVPSVLNTHACKQGTPSFGRPLLSALVRVSRGTKVIPCSCMFLKGMYPRRYQRAQLRYAADCHHGNANKGNAMPT